MKNIETWEPTKFILSKGKLLPSKSLNTASRLMANYIAEFYNLAIPKYVKGKLLDLGCGNVPMYAFYKDRISSVTCVDWPNSAHEQKYVDIFCDLNNELPFDNETFDSLICSDVLEHLKDISTIISEMHRILRKNGIALINHPFLYGLHEEPYDFARYTEYKIMELAEVNNFNVLELKSYGTIVDMFEHSTIRLIKLLPISGFLLFFFTRIIMPLINYVFAKKAKKNNKHPYMYGYVLEKK